MTEREIMTDHIEKNFKCDVILTHDKNGYFHKVIDSKTKTLIGYIQPHPKKIIFSTPPKAKRERAQNILNCDYSMTNNWPRFPRSPTRKQKKMTDLKEIDQLFKSFFNNNEVHI